MKRKYILVAAALVVLCAGAAAYSMNQNTELPSSTPNSSSAPASVASSEPESGSTSVTDNRDIAKAENFVAYQVTQESTSTDTGAGKTQSAEEIQALEKEDLSQPSDEQIIQSTIDRFGISREEAESMLKDIKAEQEEGKKQLEAMYQQRDEAYEAFEAKRNQACLDATGMTYDEYLSMSNAERFNWLSEHPDADRSFLYMQP